MTEEKSLSSCRELSARSNQGLSARRYVPEYCIIDEQLPRGMPTVEKGPIFNTGPYGEPP